MLADFLLKRVLGVFLGVLGQIAFLVVSGVLICFFIGLRLCIASGSPQGGKS